MNQETELTFYAKIGDSEGFSQAVSEEIQCQHAYFINHGEGKGKTQLRVRSTTKNGVVLYEETVKLPIFNHDVQTFGNREFTNKIEEDYFKAWIAGVRVGGVNKIRYVFLSKEVELDAGDGEIIKLPEVKYEVDVFLDKDGNKSKWCKIDIEIDHILEVLKEQHKDVGKFDATVKLSALPFKPENAFSAKTENEEEKKAIEHFWEVFTIPPVKNE